MSTRRNFYLVLIGLLAVCACRALPVSWLGPAKTPTPTVTVTPNPLPAPTFTATPVPTPTNTPTLTPTATPSPTFTPTSTPTTTLTPTDTPSPSPSATRKPIPPTSAPTPTTPPTPNVDFKLVSWRLWPLKLNGGCWGEGMHEIFVTVLDVNGTPLDGIVLGDTWNNVEIVTGLPGKDPGQAVFDLWANAMEITVKRDGATGQPYTSQASPPCGSFVTDIPDEQLIQAGYCADANDCQHAREINLCAAHFSWEVVFQKTH